MDCARHKRLVEMSLDGVTQQQPANGHWRWVLGIPFEAHQRHTKSLFFLLFTHSGTVIYLLLLLLATYISIIIINHQQRIDSSHASAHNSLHTYKYSYYGCPQYTIGMWHGVYCILGTLIQHIILCSWLEWFTHSFLLEFCAHSVSSTNWNNSGKWKSRLLHNLCSYIHSTQC